MNSIFPVLALCFFPTLLYQLNSPCAFTNDKSVENSTLVVVGWRKALRGNFSSSSFSAGHNSHKRGKVKENDAARFCCVVWSTGPSPELYFIMADVTVKHTTTRSL